MYGLWLAAARFCKGERGFGKLEPDSSLLTGVERMALADAVSSEATMMSVVADVGIGDWVVVVVKLRKKRLGSTTVVGRATAFRS